MSNERSRSSGGPLAIPASVERYPIWGDWLADADSHPERTPVIERMTVVGVLDLPGVKIGW
jgi:hypothetical protein